MLAPRVCFVCLSRVCWGGPGQSRSGFGYGAWAMGAVLRRFSEQFYALLAIGADIGGLEDAGDDDDSAGTLG